jgi:orotate phosphoribosyltransferase
LARWLPSQPGGLDDEAPVAGSERGERHPPMSDLLEVFRESGALLEGHFLLSSGLHSPRYLQCARVLMDPARATLLGAELAAALRPLLHENPAAVVAPALGGVLVAHEVARGFGCRGLFTERQQGGMALRRGFALAAGEPVVVVEDVITTGGSTGEVIAAVEACGARVLAVGSLVDRSAGVLLGVPRASLLSIEVPTWSADKCPLCAQGGQPEKPGSRA